MNKKSVEIIKTALFEGRNVLLEPEAKKICELYGIPVTKYKVAEKVSDAVKFAEEIGYPVVLKIISPDILHKTDVGGVLINLNSSREVKKAYSRVMENVKKNKADARISGVLVEKMALKSTEIIVGMIKDPTFGQTLMFGLGGIFVEILEDISFRLAPINKKDAEDMVHEIKFSRILEGARGRKPLDVDAVIDILLKVSKLVMERREIEQIDLNPTFVYEKGARVVDARIIIS